MPSIDDPKPMKKKMFLLKGGSGVGKSIQAGSFPNVYFFDFDSRIDAVINYFKGKKSDIFYDTYTPKQFEKAYNKLEMWSKRGCPHKAIVLDTSTTIVRASLNYIDEKRGGAGMHTRAGVIDPSAIDDYKFLIAAFDQMFDMLKELPNTHIIMCAHVERPREGVKIAEKPEPGERREPVVSRNILAPGKTGDNIPIHFDEIYHMEARFNPTGKAQRILHTEHIGMDFARTTLNLPRELDVTNKLLYQQLLELVPALKEVEDKNDKIVEVKAI